MRRTARGKTVLRLILGVAAVYGCDKCDRLKRLAARQGFEPRYAAPEAAVLPLNDRAVQEF